MCIVRTNTRGGCGKVVVCVYSLYKYKGRMWKGGFEILNNLNQSLNTSCMVQTILWKGFKWLPVNSRGCCAVFHISHLIPCFASRMKP